MKLAVVINVNREPAALQHAIGAQRLLLERLGTRLDSIRLAAPRLLRTACASAIAEEPDILVMVGGPRAARRAGQLAHAHGTPILFLPGFRAPKWGKHLWGSLSLGDMVDALAHGAVRPFRLSIGTVANQIFFDQACCGLLPHLPELRDALEDADTFGETWQVLSRAGELARSLLSPRVSFRRNDCEVRCASTLFLETQGSGAHFRNWREAPSSLFKCSAVQYGPLGLLGGLFGDGGRTQEFECAKLLIEAKHPHWILLDGDPVHFDGPVEFRLIPSAIRTFLFGPHRHANDNPKDCGTRLGNSTAPEPDWNFLPPSHVAMTGEPQQRRAKT